LILVSNYYTVSFSKNTQALITGLAAAIVFTVGNYAASGVAGYSLNGAREIGPRLFLTIYGYGSNDFIWGNSSH